eukprot:8707050-Pyramimonas_sp.AAC.1
MTHNRRPVCARVALRVRCWNTQGRRRARFELRRPCSCRMRMFNHLYFFLWGNLLVCLLWLGSQECEDLIRVLDKDASGTVDFDEFIAELKKVEEGL